MPAHTPDTLRLTPHDVEIRDVTERVIPAHYSVVEICDLLRNAGIVTSNSLAAAMWLITFTRLPAEQEFRSGLTFFTGSHAGKPCLCALPTKWPMPSVNDGRDRRALLQFTQCLATSDGLTFGMPELLTGLRTETTQRIAEAMIIAAGQLPWLYIAPVDIQKGR